LIWKAGEKVTREQGHTFVLVTHDASVAARAHRTVRMRDGLIENGELNGKGERDG
jgi:predicted ABC-type transport system involved in lysophospholipase L1 biosynthesis ATPase subunit